MALTPGTRFGAYEIGAQIGVGGMGVVYRATDRNLKRPVAIKVLPEAVAFDGERLARFQREAEVLASLNHPNIAQIYGLENAVGIRALVMELVEGPTLADRIAQGLIPVDEALPIARQIAEALEAAHEQGIIHRDLKPANIKLRPDGMVKVLDFGLAKATEPVSAISPSHSQSPTITTPAMTQAGVILGTAAYMAPEQAHGRAVDKRSDIWAFGVVLFEMLTGAQLFDGESVAETIGLVVTRDPDWAKLPAGTPLAVRRLLERCLARDPRRRLRDIGEARITLEDPLRGTVPAGHVATPRSRRLLLALGAGAIVLAIGTGGIVWWARAAAEPPPLRRFELAIEGGKLAPDGSQIAYVSGGQLFVQAFDDINPTNLGTVPVSTERLFWSPDGRTIGFTGEGRLRSIPARGGTIFEVAKLPPSGRVMGAAWRRDGTIVFAAWRDGLYTVPASGGTPELLVPIDPTQEIDFHGISELPDGQLVVTTHLRGEDLAYRTELIDTRKAGRRVVIIADPSVRGALYASPGYLLYSRSDDANQGLWAVPFSGPPVDLTGSVRLASRILAGWDAARDGTLVYESNEGQDNEVEIVWVDRAGEVSAIPGAKLRSPICCPALSFDGRRAALVTDSASVRNLVVRDLATGVDTRLTFQQSDVDSLGDYPPEPGWFPTGDRVLYATGAVGTPKVVVRPGDGAGAPQVLGAGSTPRVSPDGHRLLFILDEAGRGLLRQAPLSADGTVGTAERVFQALTEPNVTWFDISRDGKMLAYTDMGADRQSNVFLIQFLSGEGRRQVTSDGGTYPHFSPDGHELFYSVGAVRETMGRLMAVPVTSAPSLSVGPPTVVLEAGSGDPSGLHVGWFDVAPDGRFLMTRAIAPHAGRRTVLVQNWQAAMKK
jgi:hypothetical protein